ncbi:uncharacterized protein LOC131596355 [Vicia villosa]|uniref:uncharacterized protein LOC131596355 n=1 Tax=Vicia villosa TaxID=3911 RepID=UPI00273ADADE|nr:uncharacterized protein LOC131596355 [Vicia villosa]
MGEVVEAVPKSVVDEACSNAKVSVWWFLNNWDAYDESNALDIKDNIYSALAEKKCNGPVSIFCFGDTTLIPYTVWRSLYCTGIPISHVPAVMEDTIYLKIVVDMMLWATANPPPANYLLILGDAPISFVTQLVAPLLQKRGYNIYVSPTQNLSEPLLLEQLAPSDTDSEFHAGN